MSKRRITLYIDGRKADTDAESLVLFNYTASDLSSPAAVKNSYSQQATLPATANNDRIFSSIYRADWRASATSFNPLVRTPFALYDETGAILEAGYLKLNTTKNKNGVRSYVVTLYGGLGSFFYTLAYDDEGEAMTLGALPIVSDDPEDRVDFAITRDTVAEAWRRLRNPNAPQTRRQFDAVNFAPAYNGLPAGEFDASKGVGQPAVVPGGHPVSVGGEATYVEKDSDGNDIVYGTGNTGGNALYDFDEEFTEWEMKDLRSYMQRPVVSVKALFEGIGRYAAAKGFTLNLDPAWFSEANPYYTKAWMTLNLLAGRSVPNLQEQSITVGGWATSKNIDKDTYSYRYVDLTPTLDVSNADVTVTCKPVPIIQPVFPEGTLPGLVYLNCQADARNKQAGPVGMVFFVQVQLLDAAGKIVNASDVKVCLGINVSGEAASNLTAEEMANQADLVGCDAAEYNIDSTLYKGPSDIAYLPMELGLRRRCNAFKALGEVSATGYNAVSARVVFEPRALYYDGKGKITVTKDALHCSPDYSTGGVDPIPVYPITEWGGHIQNATLSYAAVSEEYRSGVRVTQEALFADTMSPMEFLLSYTKTFGLHYLYDTARKRVDIVTRNTLYGGRPTIDLQERIDRSQEITTEPIPMSAKWLEFGPAEIEGEFSEYYKTRYGRQYGVQKLNTGFEFDANTDQALDNAKFNGAPEVLERSKYYLYVENGHVPRIPAPIVDGKTTYKLFRKDEDGELQSVDLDYPNLTLREAGFTGFRYFNANKGYDGVPKLQCHSDDNDGTEGAGILLFHRGLASQDPSTTGDEVAKQAYEGFIITDDSGAMYDLVGKPCWELSEGIQATNLPAFGRFDMAGVVIQRSMELGTPAEIDNPVIAVGNYTSVYERCWADYMADRYDVNTRTCTAYVDLRGLQPGPDMLRNFYYFDGAIWVLNKISNYSLSRPGTTQCEFIKVQDRAAYAAGQVYTRTGVEYGEWSYIGNTRTRSVTSYTEDVYPDGTTGERRYSNDVKVQAEVAQTTVDWDGVTYWNGSCGAEYYYVDYQKVRDKYTWSDAVRYSDYRNGDSRSRRIDGQCGWVRDWRPTSDWYRSGGTCNAAGVNGAYDCDGTYSVTYWNEGQDQSYCYPDMSGSTQTRTIWRVGPEATREQVDGQCGYSPKSYQLEVTSTLWDKTSATDREDTSSLRQPDGLLVIITYCHYVARNLGATFRLNGIRLVAPDGTSSPIASGTLSFERQDVIMGNCRVNTSQVGVTDVKIQFSAESLTKLCTYDGKIAITHTTGAEIELDINTFFDPTVGLNPIEPELDAAETEEPEALDENDDSTDGESVAETVDETAETVDEALDAATADAAPELPAAN